MERQLQAPIRIEPQDSLPLSLPQAAAMLASFLTEHAGPVDTGTRALLSRLYAGIQHEISVEQGIEEDEAGAEDGAAAVETPAVPAQPVSEASSPVKKKRSRPEDGTAAIETDEERRARKKAKKAAKLAAKLAAA